MKRSGSAVFLTELLVTILFFSLTAAVVLRLFVIAHETEQDSVLMSKALIGAQNAAEEFYANGYEMFTSPGWELQPESGTTRSYRSGSGVGGGFEVEIELHGEDTAAGRIETGEVRVYSPREDEPLVCLDLARYSPDAGEGSP